MTPDVFVPGSEHIVDEDTVLKVDHGVVRVADVDLSEDDNVQITLSCSMAVFVSQHLLSGL